MTSGGLRLREDHAHTRGGLPHTVNIPPRPLVDYCTNEWRKQPEPHLTFPTEAPEDCYEDWADRIERGYDHCLAVGKAPKLRRNFFFVTFTVLFFLFLWFEIISPFVQEEQAAWASISTDIRTSGGLFGANVRPKFPSMIQIHDLDPSLLPRDDRRAANRKRRLIFIGDIHGCKKELKALLKKAHFNPATDHIIATGDIVNKGPDTAGVIDLLREHGASCVRGNHDDRILLLANDANKSVLRSKQRPAEQESISEQAYSKKDADEKLLARSLTREQLDYLRSCPLILRVGAMKSLGGDIVVVHAGLVPGLPLMRQDPASVMNMRILDVSSRVPSKLHESKGSIPWFQLWNRYQTLLPTQEKLVESSAEDTDRSNAAKFAGLHTTVIYGHNAKQGLQIEKYTRGLDTGCVKGGKLTALVLSDFGKQEIVQVDSHRDYTARPATDADLDSILRLGKMNIDTQEKEEGD